MQRIANGARVLVAMGVVVACGCGGGCGDGSADHDAGTDGPTPDAAYPPCDLVLQTGCGPGEKCAFITDEEQPPAGHVECGADGTVGTGGECTRYENGADNCVAGSGCVALCSGCDGACEEYCTLQPDSCPDEFNCMRYAGLLEDSGGKVGLCDRGCNPVLQDCPPADKACYLQAVDGDSTCAIIPKEAVGLTQGDVCYGPEEPDCYLNSCDKGYGANLQLEPGSSTTVCAFFCHPVENWTGNVNGLTGNPDGITCAATFDGERPDGPGPAYECRFIQTFYNNTYMVPETIGMCVDPDVWGGSCADFDYDQLVADIDSGVAESETYCDDFPDRCMFDCISLETYEALLAK